MIDEQGFRSNVGIILANSESQLLWARRVRQYGWQFPQGGILSEETPEEAMYRELYEELGLKEDQVNILGATQGWLYYRLPERFLRAHIHPICIGQKQKWFLLRLVAPDESICLTASKSPEFDRWRWVHYWYPLKQVISFKRHVYRRALEALAPLLPEVSRK